MSEFPFKILGTADDGNAYFLDRHDRLFVTRLENLTQTKLLKLAQVDWWIDNYAEKAKMSGADWHTAYDDIIHIAGDSDFDPDNIRGRGAWKDGGKIVYHDGKATTGKKTEQFLYLRKMQKDVGLNETPATDKLCKEISDTISQMTFETKADGFRVLAWSILAPFSGALPWRPAGLITGESGSGKTTVIDHIVKKIAKPFIYSGGETSTAGIRGNVNSDSTGIVLEESEDDTPKKKMVRDEQFSLMRQSTSDDAPDVVKGTKDGGSVSYKMRNMFLFVAISPQIESVADDNRIFKVNMKKAEGDQKKAWPGLRDRLMSLMTPENCAAIRSRTWKMLPEILEFAHVITPKIQDITGRDARASFADAMLLSAYTKVWSSAKDLTNEGIEKSLKKIYEWQPASEQRDETQEIIDKIMDEVIEIIHDTKREKITVGEALQKVKSRIGFEWEEIHRTLKRHGIAYVRSHDCIGIENNHSKIKKIIDKGTGYGDILKRHKDLKEKHYVVNMLGKSRQCTLIRWCLKEDNE